MAPCSTRFHHLRGFSGIWWSGVCEGSWWSATLLYPVCVLIGVHWWCTSSLTLQEDGGVDMKKSRDHTNERDISLCVYLSIYLSINVSFLSICCWQLHQTWKRCSFSSLNCNFLFNVDLHLLQWFFQKTHFHHHPTAANKPSLGCFCKWYSEFSPLFSPVNRISWLQLGCRNSTSEPHLLICTFLSICCRAKWNIHVLSEDVRCLENVVGCMILSLWGNIIALEANGVQFSRASIVASPPQEAKRWKTTILFQNPWGLENMMEIVSRVLHQGTVRETLHDRKRQSKLIKGSFFREDALVTCEEPWLCTMVAGQH